MKEEKFEIRTGFGDNAEASNIINIKGELDSVLIDADKPITIKIFLQEFPNIILYETNLFVGQKYLPLRKEAVFPDAATSEVPVKWVLNDKIEFHVSNNSQATVKFRVRFDA